MTAYQQTDQLMHLIAHHGGAQLNCAQHRIAVRRLLQLPQGLDRVSGKKVRRIIQWAKKS